MDSARSKDEGGKKCTRKFSRGTLLKIFTWKAKLMSVKQCYSASYEQKSCGEGLNGRSSQSCPALGFDISGSEILGL
jgi:hypothetical protein